MLDKFPRFQIKFSLDHQITLRSNSLWTKSFIDQIPEQVLLFLKNIHSEYSDVCKASIINSVLSLPPPSLTTFRSVLHTLYFSDFDPPFKKAVSAPD